MPPGSSSTCPQVFLGFGRVVFAVPHHTSRESGDSRLGGGSGGLAAILAPAP